MHAGELRVRQEKQQRGKPPRRNAEQIGKKKAEGFCYSDLKGKLENSSIRDAMRGTNPLARR
jgi:hypothetical protein